MSDLARHEHLIAELSAGLAPVRRLATPWLRALGFIAMVVAFGIALASIANLEAVTERLAHAPDMWLAMVGAALCAVLAAVAAFETSLPDRSPAWALLPIPAALLWVSASGLGCLRTLLLPGTHAASMGEMRVCLAFIIGISVPLSALLIAMLRRGCSLRPGLTASLGG